MLAVTVVEDSRVDYVKKNKKKEKKIRFLHGFVFDILQVCIFVPERHNGSH